jgi:NTE family protein
MFRAFVCLLCSFSAVSAADTKKCRALSLSGGGSKGAYEAGVLYELARLMTGSDREYDVISGISVGSLNSLALGLFEKGDEINQTEQLLEFWLNITAADIY